MDRLRRKERLAWTVLLVAALLLRLIALGAKPPHHDESIHANFGQELLHKGEYRYDPTYHGPLLFYAEAVIFAVLGESDTTARLFPALMGVILVALPLALRRRIGAGPAFFAGVMLAISPSFLYYSRFDRNDVPVALFTAAALVLFVRSRRDGWRVTWGEDQASLSASAPLLHRESWHGLPWVGVMAALHAISKETFYVMLPLMAVSAAAVGLRDGLWSSALKLVLWLRRHIIPVCTAIFWFVAIAITAYTFFFIHPEDWFFPAKAISYWYGQHKIQRVGGPWFYHLPRLGLYEFLPIGAAIAWAIRRRRRMHRIEVFCLVWGLASIVMYAYLGEKVPWLEVEQVLPFIPLAAMQLARTFGPHGRPWSRGIVIFGLVATVWSAIASSFIYPAITTSNPHAELIVFVQTTPETKQLAEHGIALAKVSSDDPTAAVNGEGTWPLSWEWRNVKVWWGLPPADMKPPLVICDAADEQKMTTQLGDAYTMRHMPLRAWWVEEWKGTTPWQVLRWFVTRRAWSPIGATEVTVFERPVGKIPIAPERK